MIASQQEIERALLDVRRAYRLLHRYQRAALDVAKYVGSQLGLSYRDGCPRFSNTAPRNGKNAFGCWAWDWLNFVHFDFNFYRNVGENREIGLTIMIVSDTGIYFGEPRDNAEPDDAAFAPAEYSKTKVGFLFFREWMEEWGHQLYAQDALRSFLGQEGVLPKILSDGGCIGKCYDFSQLSNEASTEAVITEVIQFANAGGFSLERIKKTA